MIPVGVWGASGRMGRMLVEGLRGHPALSLEPSLEDCRVVIDFSLPAGTSRLLELVRDQALVIGTTGLGALQLAQIDAHAARAPVLRASNFSAGVALLTELVARAAAALPDYDIEVVEMHHRQKRDAPSGTARTLAEAAATARGAALESLMRCGREGEVGPRPAGEIGLHALRGGDVAGEHTVYLAGPGERLALGHLATSRQAFAEGALRAAEWLAPKPPGLYQLREVLGL